MSSRIFGLSAKTSRCKVHITNGRLSDHLDPLQLPLKKAPWRQIRDVTFAYSVDIVMPAQLFDSIRPKIANDRMVFKYAKVIMKLEDILSGEFFSDYVKKGNISMLAEGDPHAGDCVMSLHSGILRLDMPHGVYERAGLPSGVTIQSGGQKHKKSRFRVEYDLRSTSMLKGKNGFERLLYAARNAVGLREARNWLFQDLEYTNSDCTTRPIMKHHPILVEAESTMKKMENVLVPDLVSWSADDFASNNRSTEEELIEVAEWLDLVKVDSERTYKDAATDSFICQYSLPGHYDKSQSLSLQKLSWQGFIDAEWVAQLVSELIRCTGTNNSSHWLSLSTVAHCTEAIGQAEGYTILVQPIVGEEELSPTGPTRKQKQHQGLQSFTVFQYVDSLTP